MSNRNRGIKSMDLVCFGVVSITALTLLVFALLTQDTWPTSLVIALVAGSTMAMIGLLLFYTRKWLEPPTFYTSHGVAVWAEKVPVNREGMEVALNRFLDVMKKEAGDKATRCELEKMLVATGVEWERGRVSLITPRYAMRGKTGIQHGNRLMIQWRGSIEASALYHELLHEVNEVVRLPKLPLGWQTQFRIDDIQHTETAWWMLEGIMRG